MKEFRSISTLIQEHLPEIEDPPVDDSIQASLVEHWQISQGDLGLYTFPILFRSGRLVVFCDSAVWATQVRHRAPSLMRQLKLGGFEATTLKTRVRPISRIRPHPPNPHKHAQPISGKNADEMEALSNRVQHAGLQKSLRRLARRSN